MLPYTSGIRYILSLSITPADSWNTIIDRFQYFPATIQ